ncbi:MAG: TorF family putative porin [Burkholderiales bacterium]
MHTLTRSLVLAGVIGLPALAASSAVLADAAAPVSPLTGNMTIASEYVYRGISQTHRQAAIQGGFDYASPSGFYVGTWASNISWISDLYPGTSAPIEIDVYGGFKNSFAGGDWNYDVGVLTYNYPTNNLPAAAANPDTTELYGLIGYKWVSLKYSQSTTNLFGAVNPSTLQDSKGSGYLDLSANYDLGAGWGLSGHVGHQQVKNFSDASYTDWKLGVTKDVGFGTVGLNYLDTNSKGDCSKAEPYCVGNKDIGSGTLVLSFGKTF